MTKQQTVSNSLTTPSPRPADWVHNIRPYSSQKRAAKIDLRLDSNEGPLAEFPFSESLTPNSVRDYPNKLDLEIQLADRYDIDPTQVIVTCGGDELIDRVCRCYLQQRRNIVIPEPTFVMIRQFAAMASGEVRSVDWPAGGFPVREICAASDNDTAMIAVVSPNNPTGAIVTAAQLRELALHCPQALILVDQAYAEFEDHRDADDGESLTQVALREIPNAVVVRTFSKAWGLAGLRVGYGLANSEIIQILRRAGGPYPVSGPSLLIAAAAQQTDAAGKATYVSQVRRERVALERLLNELGATALPSQANFVFARFPSSSSSATFVCEELASVGISVRSFNEMPDALRITCPGDQTAFDRLCSSLKKIMAP